MNFFLVAAAAVCMSCSCVAQQSMIEGLWYSTDSTRIYEISKHNNEYQARLYASKRETEKPGTAVISALEQRHNKEEYHGYIHALDDGTTTALKITTSENGQVLKLKLRRLFLFPLKLTWFRVVQ